MNKRLEQFIKDTFPAPKKALDLGAGDFEDVDRLTKIGWDCEGVDLKTGTNLEERFMSKNAPFDLVYSNHVLHFLTDKKNLIKSAYDNLVDDGWFFFQDMERSVLTNAMYLPEPEMKKLIEHIGFKIISAEKFDFFDDKPNHMHWHTIIEIHAKKLKKEK